MKRIVRFIVFISLVACHAKKDNKEVVSIEIVPNMSELDRTNHQDSLFRLEIKPNDNFVSIVAPNHANFELPDSSAKIEPYKIGDFNSDNKEDILVYLGACGTGGCMYALFLNQFDQFYSLAFMDYLKNATCKIENNGLWTIESSEEIEPYNPSKLNISVYRFDKNIQQYKLDSTYVYIDNEVKK